MALSNSTARAQLVQASNNKITNLSLPTANTEVQHTLQDGVSQIILRMRIPAVLKVSFTATESGSKYVTIPSGTSFALDGIKLTGASLYLQSPTGSSIVEILELY